MNNIPMDPCKIAFITEALNGFNVQELQFLYGFIHAKLSRVCANHNVVPTAVTPPPEIQPAHPEKPPEEKISPKTPVVADESGEKKIVKWADIAATPPTAEESGKKVFKKTPHRSVTKKNVVVPTFEKSSEKKSRKPRKKSTDRSSLTSEPRETPYAGKEWKNFCNQENCSCVYTFRDHAADENLDQATENLDPVRYNPGHIYNNQLYVRGWNPELVNWETARKRLWEELSDVHLEISQIYVDSKGFAFITFSNHEIATKSQKMLLDIPSFYGDKLLVNFATIRK